MRQDGALSAAKSLVQADNSRCDSGSAGLSHDPPLLTRAGTVCDALHFFLVTPIALLLLHLKLAARAALPSAALCVGAQSHHLPIIPPCGLCFFDPCGGWEPGWRGLVFISFNVEADYYQ